MKHRGDKLAALGVAGLLLAACLVQVLLHTHLDGIHHDDHCHHLSAAHVTGAALRPAPPDPALDRDLCPPCGPTVVVFDAEPVRVFAVFTTQALTPARDGHGFAPRLFPAFFLRGPPGI